MRVRYAMAVPLLVALLSGGASAACVARSASTRAHLLELYTSEGCSSCPPAERWFSALTTSDTLVPLGFHVDYWDTSGWHDRFDDPRYTARQSELSARGGKSVVYTPEVVLDGREWRGWSGAVPPTSTDAPLAALVLHVDPGPTTRVRLESRFASERNAGGYRAYFAVIEDGLSSNVHAGENRGALLRHDHVVRVFSGPLPLARASADLSLPADLQTERATVVAFVQDPASGIVVQAVQRRLATCGSR